MIRVIAISLALAFATPVVAQEPGNGDMTVSRALEILLTLDPAAEPSGSGIELTIEDVPVLVFFDVAADRMRAMVPIRAAEDMNEDDIRRVLQANFDTALDARYAIAQGKLWGAFIHPLSPLRRDELISGLGQTVNLALSYGTTFSSGALAFGGGDSLPLQRDLIDRLLEKGQDI